MSEPTSEIPLKKDDVLITFLNKVIIYAIKALAIMMIVVIFASVVDVAYVVYDKIIYTNPIGVLHVENILTVLGAFITVFIAIGVFNNIVIYIKEDSLQAKLVLSTALIAVSRKVIILDYKNPPPEYIYATAALIVATAVAYWIVSRKSTGEA